MMGQRVSEAVPAATRALEHMRIAERLRRHGADEIEICEHLLQAPGAGSRANVQILRSCAGRHRRRGEIATACEALARALREPPPEEQLPELLAELAETLLEGGRHQEALDCAGRAQALATERPVRARAAAMRFRASIGCGDVELALAELTAEIGRLEAEDPSLALQLELELLRAGPGNGRILEEALARYRRRTIDESLPAAAGYLTAAGQLLAAGEQVSAAEALLTVRRGLRLQAREPFDIEPVLRSVWLLTIAEQPQEASAAIDSARLRAGEQAELPRLDALEGLLALRFGSIDEARELLQRALKAASRRGDPFATGLARALLAHALLESDEHEALRRLLAEHTECARAKGLLAALMRVVRGRLELEAGRPHRTLEELTIVEQRMVALGLTNPAGIGHAEPAVAAMLELGEADAATAMARESLRRAQAWGTPAVVALAQRTLAACLAPRPRLELLAEAAATLERSPAKLAKIELLLALGRAESLCGRRRSARQTLTHAHAQAEAAGAARLARLARAELETLEGGQGGGNALTAGEQRVAALAAAGLSNREVATRLHLSVRTVENVLHRVYAKLECTRGELLERLAQ